MGYLQRFNEQTQFPSLAAGDSWMSSMGPPFMSLGKLANEEMFEQNDSPMCPLQTGMPKHIKPAPQHHAYSRTDRLARARLDSLCLAYSIDKMLQDKRDSDQNTLDTAEASSRWTLEQSEKQCRTALLLLLGEKKYQEAFTAALLSTNTSVIHWLYTQVHSFEDPSEVVKFLSLPSLVSLKQHLESTKETLWIEELDAAIKLRATTYSTGDK